MKTLLTLALLLAAAPAFAGETADSAPDIARSDIRHADEPYVVVQWMPADEDDSTRTGNAQHESEQIVVD
jgi:hypothetical protein